jgi:ankyrin repeat protein
MKGGTDRRSVPRVRNILRSCVALAAVGLFVASPPTQLAYDQNLTPQTPRLEDAKTTASDASESRAGAGSRLAAAVSKNDLSTVRRLLAAGVDPNSVDATATPVLVRAAGSGRTAIVGALLDAGANSNATAPVDGDQGGWPSALMAAAGEGHLDVVELLIARGADVNANYEAVEQTFPTALLAAIASGRAEVVRALLDAGADISAKGVMGLEAIHDAALDSDLEIVELLLAHGAEVDTRDGLGGTPLMWAAGAGQVKMVRLLIARGANVNARDDATRRAYFKAEFVGDTATMREIKRSGRLAFVIEDGVSVLDHAKVGGNREVIRLLLAAGAK